MPENGPPSSPRSLSTLARNAGHTQIKLIAKTNISPPPWQGGKNSKIGVLLIHSR
jgi:hypothetical protein